MLLVELDDSYKSSVGLHDSNEKSIAPINTMPGLAHGSFSCNAPSRPQASS